MECPPFSNRDYDEYDASQLTLKQLEYMTEEHVKDCECAYCVARDTRREIERKEGGNNEI